MVRKPNPVLFDLIPYNSNSVRPAKVRDQKNASVENPCQNSVRRSKICVNLPSRSKISCKHARTHVLFTEYVRRRRGTSLTKHPAPKKTSWISVCRALIFMYHINAEARVEHKMAFVEAFYGTIMSIVWPQTERHKQRKNFTKVFWWGDVSLLLVH